MQWSWHNAAPFVTCGVLCCLVSQYTLYQHFLHTPDAQVGSLLRLFTTLDLPEIESVMQRHVENPGQRTAQRVLAQHVTTDVRGEQALSSAEQVSGRTFEAVRCTITPLRHTYTCVVPGVTHSLWRLPGGRVGQ